MDDPDFSAFDRDNADVRVLALLVGLEYRMAEHAVTSPENQVTGLKEVLIVPQAPGWTRSLTATGMRAYPWN